MKLPIIKKEESKEKVYVNPNALGKAGNNAIQILIAANIIVKDDGFRLNQSVLQAYKSLSKQIYKADLEVKKELENE